MQYQVMAALAGDRAFFCHDAGRQPMPLAVRDVCSNRAPGTRIYARGPEGF